MGKIKFVICDDDPHAASILLSHIKKLCDRESIPYTAEIFADGELFLTNYKENIDMIFMDIEMPLLDGLETSKLLRTRDDHATIVFTTSHEKYAVRGYEVSAYRYLVKPVCYEVFERELAEKIRAIFARKDNVIYLKTDSGAESVLPHEIMYIETLYNHRLMIHCRSRCIEVYRNMNQFEEILDKSQFFRCHTSFIINFSSVVRIEKNEIIMKDQQCIPLSKYRRKEFMDRFMNYAKEVL